MAPPVPWFLLVILACVTLLWLTSSSEYAFPTTSSGWVPSSFRTTQVPGSPYVRRVKLQHPIPRLMDEAEKSYRLKLGSQSKTLKQAVKEYKRRYKRLPPKGFDKWWSFAKSSNFLMMDEFDSLNADLEPFWGLSTEELRRRTGQMASLPAVDIVQIKGGNATVLPTMRRGSILPPSERSNHFIMMMEKFVSNLPDMNFSISTKPESRVMVPWEHLSFPNSTIQDSFWGIKAVLGGPFVEDWRGEGSVWEAFRRSCPPGSPARRLFGSMRGHIHPSQQAPNILQRGQESPVLHPNRLGLTRNLEDSANYCEHPWGRYLQGHFFSDWRTVGALYPIFSPGKAPGHNDIVIPSHYYYGETKRYTYGRDPVKMITKQTDNYEIDWEDKKDQIFWRGASTGGGSNPPGFLDQYQRHRLTKFASYSSSENATVIFPESSVAGNKAYVQASIPASTINQEIFDVAFTSAVGCSLYTSGGCAGMERELPFSDAVQLSDHWKYKYLIDIDGMGYSARFLAFMASESAVLKSSVYREFFSDWIQPWLHFVPVSQTYSDLYNIHAYFSGPTKSAVEAAQYTYPNFTAPSLLSAGHEVHEGDRRLRRIARAGRKWKQSTTRRVDQEIFVYRLAIEWARLWADDREAMVFQL